MQFLDLTFAAAAAALAACSAVHAQTAPVTALETQTPIAAAGATLSVTFTGVEAKRGKIMLALYDEAGWSSGRPVRAEMVDTESGSASVTIADLPAGRYGVKAFHDLNGNGKMDSNPFGMPTEPYAFSNNAKGQRGPALWADAAFTVAMGNNAQSITIR